MIIVNSRILAKRLTGVQRYLYEILKRFPDRFKELYPQSGIDGIAGHAWEQLILPNKISRRDLLWSPSNTGPLAHSSQVVTMHDIVPFDHPEWLNPRFAAWYRFLTPRLLRRVDHVIAVSNFTKDRILEMGMVSPNKISVVHNGVDRRFHPYSNDEHNRIIKKLNIPTRRYLLSLGSIEPRKNLKRLISIWARIQHKIDKDIWLVVAGGRGSTSVFRDVSFDSMSNRIFFTGHVADEDLPMLYSNALAFAYLSEYEGFGLPPLEAMASGVPVISANKTALPEVIGSAGVLVDPLNDDEIAEGLLLLLCNESRRNMYARLGLDRAKQFSWDNCALQTFQILTSLE